MKEAGNLGVPFMEPDHDGGEWEEWVDWSAPAVAGRVTSGGGQAAGTRGRAGAGARGRRRGTCMSLWTLLFTRRGQGGCAARLVARDGLNFISALTCNRYSL